MRHHLASVGQDPLHKDSASFIQIKCELKYPKRVGHYGRYSVCFCSACGHILCEHLSHENLEVHHSGTSKVVSKLDVAFAIASNEASVKLRGLNKMQLALRLPLTNWYQFSNADKAVAVHKMKQAQQQCDGELARIKRSRKHCYARLRSQSTNAVYKCVAVGFDGSWHNRRYSRSSRNDLITFIDNHTVRVVVFDTRVKGDNYPMSAPSGNMENDMLGAGIVYAHSKGIHMNKISIDGDAKIPKLCASLNANNAIIGQLSPIELYPVSMHSLPFLCRHSYLRTLCDAHVCVALS